MSKKEYGLHEKPIVEKTRLYYIQYGKDRVVNLSRPFGWRSDSAGRINTDSLDSAASFSTSDKNKAVELLARIERRKVSKKVQIVELDAYVVTVFRYSSLIKEGELQHSEVVYIEKPTEAAKSKFEVYMNTINSIKEDIKYQLESIEEDKQKIKRIESLINAEITNEEVAAFVNS